MFGQVSSRCLCALVLTLLAACSPQEEAAAPVEDARPAPLPTETETLADVRQVIPGQAVHVPAPGTYVERLPAPDFVPPPPRPVSLGIVVVDEANRLDTRRGPVRLIGTSAIAPDRLCTLSDGRTPLCATLARTAVRRFVGQRSVACTLATREDTAQDHIAPCFVGEQDLSLWVVEQGWAFADNAASDAILSAQEQAQAGQRGLWAVMSR